MQITRNGIEESRFRSRSTCDIGVSILFFSEKRKKAHTIYSVIYPSSIII